MVTGGVRLPDWLEWIGQDSPPPGLAAVAEAQPGEVIAFPGLINAHDHLAFNCYPPTGKPPYHDFLEWSRDVQAERGLIETVEAVPRAVRVQFGLLKNLLWGVTAVADHGGDEHSGNGPIAVLPPYTDLHSPELETRRKWLKGVGPVVLHLAEGTTPESRQRALSFLKGNLLRRRVVGVHGVSLEAGDFGRLSAFVWCPASNLFLFGRTADAAAAAERTELLLGTDSTLSAPGTLWDHLRQARGAMPDDDLFAALTARAERFWRIGRRNDFVVARRRMSTIWDAFFAVTPGDILLVVRGGRAVLIDAALTASKPFSEGFFPLDWDGSRKFVRMNLPEMVRATLPQLDPAVLIGRFAGVSAAGRRAA